MSKDDLIRTSTAKEFVEWLVGYKGMPKEAASNVESNLKEQFDRYEMKGRMDRGPLAMVMCDGIMQITINRGASLVGGEEKFTKHTEAVATFLNELYAILVDPLADGSINVATMQSELLKAAIDARDLANRVQQGPSDLNITLKAVKP